MEHYETIGTPSNPIPMNECYGTPTHLDQLEPILKPVLKCIYAILQLLFLGYACTRLSILAIYLRVFTGRYVRFATYFMIGFVSVSWLAFAITGVLSCTPIQAFWDRTIVDNVKCLDPDRFYEADVAINMILDIGVVFIPLPTILFLNISKTRKMGLSFIFGIGLTYVPYTLV